MGPGRTFIPVADERIDHAETNNLQQVLLSFPHPLIVLGDISKDVDEEVVGVG